MAIFCPLPFSPVMNVVSTELIPMFTLAWSLCRTNSGIGAT